MNALLNSRNLMHTIRRTTGILIALLILSLASEQNLKAYTDPGSGAMFVQILLAGIVGGLFRIRTIVGRFRRRKIERVNA